VCGFKTDFSASLQQARTEFLYHAIQNKNKHCNSLDVQRIFIKKFIRFLSYSNTVLEVLARSVSAGPDHYDLKVQCSFTYSSNHNTHLKMVYE